MYTAFQKDNVHYDQNWGRPVHSLDHKNRNRIWFFQNSWILIVCH